MATGIAFPAANPGIQKFNGWDFCRLPNGRLLVACTPHVDTWVDATNGKYREHRLRVYVYDDAVTPEPASYVEIETSWCNAVAIDSDAAGRVHLLYYFWDVLEAAAQKTKILYRMSPDGGTSWTAAVQVPHVGTTYLTAAPLIGMADQRNLHARINPRTGLFNVVLRGSGTGGDPQIGFMVGSPDSAGWTWSNVSDFNNPGGASQGDIYEIQATLGGDLLRFPRRNSITNITAAGAYNQTLMSSVAPSGAAAIAGLVDEFAGAWLMMQNYGNRALFPPLTGDGVLFAWAVRPVNSSGGFDAGSTATSTGPSLAYPNGYIEAYNTPTAADGYLPGSGRIRRRADGVYEFLYSRYPDGNLVFNRCRFLPGTVSPANPGTWQT